jgi:methionyl-tRNA formyltransferase
MRVVFFGTPAFAVPTLIRLAHSTHTVAGVVTQPDRPRGRGQQLSPSPVKAEAAALNLPVLQPDRLSSETFAPPLRALNADIGVVAAYGKILPDWLLAALPHGFINVHASLLPRYRGASPIHRAVMNGDEQTGATIMRVVKELDAGPMITCAAVPIDPNDTTTMLEARLAVLGADLLVDTLDAIEAGTAIETPQDASRATYAPKIEKAEGLIDWSRPASQIHNQIRGLWPWPHASTYLDGTRYILHRSRLSPLKATSPPGTIITASVAEGVHVACGHGTALELMDIQLEGKRSMKARDALAARTLVPGARFSGR